MAGPGGDQWAELTSPFVDGHYGSLRGWVRTQVIDRHLSWHLPPPPAEIVDIGGGAGHQALPLARAGYSVTIVDPSPAMLARARELFASEPDDVRSRARLVEGRGEDATALLGKAGFAAALCHGVLMYQDDPAPLIGVLAQLLVDGGVVSVVAKSALSLAVRPALDGRWAEALAAFGCKRQVNGLGVDTRADTVEDLKRLLASNEVEPVAWYGVRLFSDGWSRESSSNWGERPAAEANEGLLAVELEASRRDPYRQMSRLFHLLGLRHCQPS